MTCEHYKDEMSCLSCPYSDPPPCRYGDGENVLVAVKINLPRALSDKLGELSRLTGASKSALAAALIKQGAAQLQPEYRELMK